MIHSADRILENPFDSHLGYLLRRASNAIIGELAQRLDAIGLKVSEASILLLIEHNPRITQSDLGRMLGIKRANMVPLAAGLESRGLVTRQPVNGRSHGLTLTETGKATCTNARGIMAEQERFILERLGGDDRAARSVLTRLWS
ncbi:MarR family winged helix-turn-helix transcriptional regulator [Sphingomonas sp. CFBP 8760]|uniref:MarR family winged helix-turn-helix transcriptional regulator n=1 Tax=Sphingomonas sp. CFBP 8760 TaxID=2775282 RepID=UPI0017800E88|nr:MarR family transcriptional regulator [Sphingomonas sp. CFBP 8760]MBD8545154.1 MarR family transcriptional regulator [Sphingomonas sp. CFBP 8760]